MDTTTNRKDHPRSPPPPRSRASRPAPPELAEQLGQFTEEEFRAIAGITPSTCLAWRKRHKGPPWARIGKYVYYPRAAVAEWLASKLRHNEPRVAGVL